METIEQEMNNAQHLYSVEVSMAPQIDAMVSRFSTRGVTRAVAKEVDEQVARERQTRTIAPQAYRLELMNDLAIGRCYRRGKENMSSADLIRYFSETRAMRTKNTDFSVVPTDEACAELGEVRSAVRGEQRPTLLQSVKELPKTVKQLPATLAKTVRTSFPVWFDRRAVNAEKESRRFPLSAFAALAAIAVSLMMIVAGSVLVDQGEKRVNRLTVELSELSGEVADLQSELSVQNDMLEVREYAIEELGMIEERYVKTDYLSLGNEDSIEVYEQEKEQNVGVSALLSALGIK